VVRRLDLSSCSLPSFPATQMASLVKLEALVLANNALREWPLPPAPACPPLRSLDVSQNPLSLIPDDALSACLSTLTHLNLSCIHHHDSAGFPSLAIGRCANCMTGDILCVVSFRV
jgi:Leucine-rich repeat (LRR) protein